MYYKTEEKENSSFFRLAEILVFIGVETMPAALFRIRASDTVDSVFLLAHEIKHNAPD